MEAKLSSRNKAIVDLEQNFNRILTESGHDDAFERVDSLVQAVKEVYINVNLNVLRNSYKSLG